MSADHLLPPNFTALEQALSLGNGERLEAVPVPFRPLWDPWTCPAELLPWLAWALSVDQWDDTWSEQTLRRIIAGSIDWHRRKGTPWAVRTALERLGFSNIQIFEITNQRYDGTLSYDGAETYGTDLGPYEFDVALNIATSELSGLGALGEVTPELAAEIRRQIDLAKNERSKLRNLSAYALYYDGRHAYDAANRYDGGLL